MNAERLLANFGRVADAPDAIPRLRRLILDLAVRGKLVEQDPNDEPAGELLKRIEQTRGEKSKRKLANIEIKPTETDFSLPKSWSLAPLFTLGDWAIGTGFPKREQGRTEGPYFFLKVSDMNLPENEKIIVTAQNRIDDEIATRSRAKIHSIRTIIFPKIGGAIATNKRRILGRPSAIDNNCLGITINDEINLDWAYLLLMSIDFTQYQAGTAVPALQQGVLEQIPVAIPPLAEQHRIVAKVDELMALCDKLEAAQAERETKRERLAAASLARLNEPDPETFYDDARFALGALPALTKRPEQITQLRRTILNLAVRGKLVEQDPNDEPAEELLKRIAAKKASLVKNGKNRKTKQLPPTDIAGILADLPARWAFVKLAEISNIVMGQSPPGHTYNTHGEGVPLINGPVEFSEGPFGETTANQYTTTPTNFCKRGDFLICVRGSTTGRSNIAAFDACIGRGVAAIQPLFDDYYIRLFLWHMREQIISMGRGAAFPSITRNQLENLPVPFPPLPEQHRIVAKVDELMGLCDQLEASLANGEKTSSRLLDSLLAEAISA